MLSQVVLLQYKAKPYLGFQNLGCHYKMLGCHFDIQKRLKKHWIHAIIVFVYVVWGLGHEVLCKPTLGSRSKVWEPLILTKGLLSIFVRGPNMLLHNSSSAGVKRNFWLHAMCACTVQYSTYEIRWENWWLGLEVWCLGKCVGLGFGLGLGTGPRSSFHCRTPMT